MKKKLFAQIIFIMFLSLTYIYSSISIKNSDANTKPLAVLLKYDSTNYYFYYKLDLAIEKKFPFNRGNKKLIAIKVYSIPIKNKAGKEIKKTMQNKKLHNGGKIQTNILSTKNNDLLMTIDKNLKNHTKYILTSDGQGIATEQNV
ncbi:hypothetical protein GF322_03215 [Candidatus Dependentiae bacterium]|nr:hypothetical protein [Candidatus Dependentiae bacterium]